MDQPTSFKFGPMAFRTTGLGLYFCNAKRLAKISALSAEARAAVHAEATKQARAAERAVNRLAKPECYINDYDRAYHVYAVCDAIAKATA